MLDDEILSWLAPFIYFQPPIAPNTQEVNFFLEQVPQANSLSIKPWRQFVDENSQPRRQYFR